MPSSARSERESPLSVAGEIGLADKAATRLIGLEGWRRNLVRGAAIVGVAALVALPVLRLVFLNR